MKDLHEDSMWRAVAERDSSYDGLFFFGVSTTGVYCRPGCPARTPRRENVVFAFSREWLERAGFRPCRRCRPEMASPNSADAEMVVHLCRLIEQAERTLSLKELSQEVGVSESTVSRLFQVALGVTPRQYTDALRLRRFRAALHGAADVAAAAFDSGYGSARAVYEGARGRLGMTPKTYGRRGDGVDIDYNIAATPLGHLLVACTSSGVCAVKLGDDPKELERELECEFAAAKLHNDTDKVGEWMMSLVDYLAGRLPWPELPYDVRATAFQRRVWDFLRKIPPGRKVRYAEIAEALGAPKAARAVGRACATNPVALVVPCHRVVGKDGRLTGYRWGLERKRRLLELEGCD